MPTVTKPFSPARKAALVAATVAGACSVLIAPWEGKRNTAYIPVPGDKPTICYGETEGVKLGMVKSDKECTLLLQKSAYEHGLGIAACMKVEPPAASMRAFISFGYNVGTYNFCHSTLLKKLNTGDLAGACYELPKWISGPHKKKLAGLVNRRAAEYAECRKGVTTPVAPEPQEQPALP